MELILERIAKRKAYTIGHLATLKEEPEEYRTYTVEELPHFHISTRRISQFPETPVFPLEARNASTLP